MASSTTNIEAGTGAISITPHATDYLSKPIRYFMVGGQGNMDVVMRDGTTVVITGLVPGVQYVGNVVAVRTTSTTATGIIGFY